VGGRPPRASGVGGGGLGWRLSQGVAMRAARRRRSVPHKPAAGLGGAVLRPQGRARVRSLACLLRHKPSTERWLCLERRREMCCSGGGEEGGACVPNVPRQQILPLASSSSNSLVRTNRLQKWQVPSPGKVKRPMYPSPSSSDPYCCPPRSKRAGPFRNKDPFRSSGMIPSTESIQ
jgi:hypothetical protein